MDNDTRIGQGKCDDCGATYPVLNTGGPTHFCTNPKPPVVPTVSVVEEVRKFVSQQHKEAWEDAKKSPTSSPWRLVQLAGIKNTEKAFLVMRNLLIDQIASQRIDVATPDVKRSEIIAQVTMEVDFVLKAEMYKPWMDLDTK